MSLPPAYPSAADYSTTPHETGARWIDGRPIYRAVVDMGNLPAGDVKAVGFDDGSNGLVDTVISLQAMAKQDDVNDKFRPLTQVQDAVTGNVMDDTGVEVGVTAVTGAAFVSIETEGGWSGTWTVIAIVEFCRAPL